LQKFYQLRFKLRFHDFQTEHRANRLDEWYLYARQAVVGKVAIRKRS
jgi:hypothetical protein